jgi:hypothetical protein
VRRVLQLQKGDEKSPPASESSAGENFLQNLVPVVFTIACNYDLVLTRLLVSAGRCS